MSRVPLTASSLDATACAGCGGTASCDDESSINGRCHPTSPVHASYRHGIVTLSCAACGAFVTSLALARNVACASKAAAQAMHRSVS